MVSQQGQDISYTSGCYTLQAHQGVIPGSLAPTSSNPVIRKQQSPEHRDSSPDTWLWKEVYPSCLRTYTRGKQNSYCVKVTNRTPLSKSHTLWEMIAITPPVSLVLEVPSVEDAAWAACPGAAGVLLPSKAVTVPASASLRVCRWPQRCSLVSITRASPMGPHRGSEPLCCTRFSK